ncbi:hypothetical protein [Haloferula sargassicola]|uniref:hypothetical protein n=1 Tax=Haloferula sargassicola TaxID=490096 RepID=UPI00336577FD
MNDLVMSLWHAADGTHDRQLLSRFEILSELDSRHLSLLARIKVIHLLFGQSYDEECDDHVRLKLLFDIRNQLAHLRPHSIESGGEKPRILTKTKGLLTDLKREGLVEKDLMQDPILDWYDVIQKERCARWAFLVATTAIRSMCNVLPDGALATYFKETYLLRAVPPGIDLFEGLENE